MDMRVHPTTQAARGGEAERSRALTVNSYVQVFKTRSVSARAPGLHISARKHFVADLSPTVCGD